MNADGLDRLVARFRLVRDRVLPHAWSVFHCVASPRIPVHHAHKLPIGGELCSYFLLKSLTQSFPLEWRDVLRYQRLRKLHAISMRRIVLRSGTRPGLTRRDYWLAAGAAYVVTMSSFVLSTIASSSPRSRSGTPNFARVWWKSSMNASHSAPEMSSSRCASSIVRPE